MSKTNTKPTQPTKSTPAVNGEQAYREVHGVVNKLRVELDKAKSDAREAERNLEKHKARIAFIGGKLSRLLDAMRTPAIDAILTSKPSDECLRSVLKGCKGIAALRQRGATTGQITEALRKGWGEWGVRGEALCHARGGTTARVWFDKDGFWQNKKPDLEGAQLAAEVRRVLQIPEPTKPAAAKKPAARALGLPSLKAPTKPQPKPAAAKPTVKPTVKRLTPLPASVAKEQAQEPKAPKAPKAPPPAGDLRELLDVGDEIRVGHSTRAENFRTVSKLNGPMGQPGQHFWTALTQTLAGHPAGYLDLVRRGGQVFTDDGEQVLVLKHGGKATGAAPGPKIEITPGGLSDFLKRGADAQAAVDKAVAAAGRPAVPERPANQKQSWYQWASSVEPLVKTPVKPEGRFLELYQQGLRPSQAAKAFLDDRSSFPLSQSDSTPHEQMVAAAGGAGEEVAP